MRLLLVWFICFCVVFQRKAFVSGGTSPKKLKIATEAGTTEVTNNTTAPVVTFGSGEAYNVEVLLNWGLDAWGASMYYQMFGDCSTSTVLAKETDLIFRIYEPNWDVNANTPYNLQRVCYAVITIVKADGSKAIGYYYFKYIAPWKCKDKLTPPSIINPTPGLTIYTVGKGLSANVLVEWRMGTAKYCSCDSFSVMFNTTLTSGTTSPTFTAPCS